MSTAEQRLAANRANALMSTGPVTPEGKSRSCANAMRHGLLSNRLLLDDECPAEFETLFDELQSALGPVGFLELTLVERIAISIWRQRRLVHAEAAALKLGRQPARIAACLTSELRRGYGSELKEDDLQPVDQARVEWCNTVLAEIEGLEQIDPDSLPHAAPTVFEQLQEDAEGESIATYLAGHKGGLTGFVAELLKWCHEQLEEARQRPKLLGLAEDFKRTRLLLDGDALDVFSRYQTTLDNQLMKGLRALREAQDWRLKTLDGNCPSKPTKAVDIVS